MRRAINHRRNNFRKRWDIASCENLQDSFNLINPVLRNKNGYLALGKGDQPVFYGKRLMGLGRQYREINPAERLRITDTVGSKVERAGRSIELQSFKGGPCAEQKFMTAT